MFFTPPRLLPRLTALALAPLLALTTGCLFGGIEGSGIEAERTRSFSTAFDQVEIHGGAFDTVDLYVCDCKPSVRLRGDDNLLELVNTSLEGDTLRIDQEEPLDPELPLIVEVYTYDLSLVSASGSSEVRVIDLSGGDLTVRSSGSSDIKLKGALDALTIETSGSSDIDLVELSAERLTLDTSGSSDVELEGEVEELTVKTSGSSDIDAFDLTAKRAVVRSSGSSDVNVCVTERLEVESSGSSDITYDCDPVDVIASTSGSSDVRAR